MSTPVWIFFIIGIAFIAAVGFAAARKSLKAGRSGHVPGADSPDGQSGP